MKGGENQQRPFNFLSKRKNVKAIKIGLIDVDSHKFPNLALMKLSAWHKAKGDKVEWWHGFTWYDRIYMSRVFDSTYTPDPLEPINCDELIKGGTGWPESKDLPEEAEHIYPDYDLYGITDTAYGFLTRGCPRGCDFCIVAGKEGRKSRKVADLSEWWRGQKNIVLMDPNILACKEHLNLLGQLADSNAYVDINQGLDARMLTRDNAEALKRIRLSEVHFAWDRIKDREAVLRGLYLWRSYGKKVKHGTYGMVFLLTNFGTTHEEDLERIYTIRDMGYDPYVMIFDKPNAPLKTRQIQRWCNNKWIFKATKKFDEYKTKKG